MQAVASGDGDVSYALAQQMLEDDVDLQSNAWEDALFVLFQEAEKQNATKAALDFVERQLPGFSDFSQPAPPKIIVARIAALAMFHNVEPLEELKQRLAQLDQYLNGADPRLQMQIMALRGEANSAIDMALTELFSKPAISYVDIDRTFGLRFMAEVTADPRIQQALARWREEKEKAAEVVRDYLAGVEAI